ncbi:MAG TPA: carbohydrate porin, partial [Gemmataceae bacterium]
MAAVAPSRRAGLRLVAVGATVLAAFGPARVAGDPPRDQPAESASKEEGPKNPPETKSEKPEEAGAEANVDEWYSIHGQATVISQGNWKFRSPYIGPNSLLPILNYRTTNTDTLYLDTRLWRGAELVFNPEVSGGEGLSHTLGMAGFPNGEATRVGALAPTPYVARLFLRQTFGLDGDMERVEAGPNQLARWRDVDRVTVTVGKMSATDLFDDNRYSHDPRTQFMNWSLMYNGAWDYPANTRGYTYGAAIDFNTRFLAVRYGAFAEPAEANGADFDPHFLKANGQIAEVEERYELCGHPGKLREWGYLNHAHMGNYREALAEMPVNPDVTLTRTYRFKYGFGVNVEQELATNLGVFLRAGWNDGQSESWAFTEIDRTVATGLDLKGALWSRPKDEAGVAVVFNGLSDAHRDYLAAGGVGFIIGDGRLNYSTEQILEAYYNWQVVKGINVSFDFQGVNHPAYNADRGPV